MPGLDVLGGRFRDEKDESLLFFFLLLVIIFCNCGLFDVETSCYSSSCY